MTVLFAEANALHEAGDVLGQRVFRFLGSLASLHLIPDNKEEPFGPMIQTSTGRSAIVDDYSDDDLQTLAKVLPDIKDADFRARVADVIWLRRRAREYAEAAVEAYLRSSEILQDAEMWPRFMPQLERAVAVAAALGRQQPFFVKAISTVENLLSKYFETDAGLLSSRLMQILLEHNQGDSAALAEKAETLALRAEANKNWLFARTYWDLSNKWHRKANNVARSKSASIRGAETFIGEAEAALQRDPPTYLVAAHFLSLSVEALRRAGAAPERIEEIHKRLIASNEKSTSEIGTIRGPEVDISELVKGAEELVEGLSFSDAVFRLAMAHSTINREELRKEVLRNANEFPFQHLMSSAAINAQGKVIAQRPSLLTNDPQQLEAAIRAEMFHQAHLRWSFATQVFIDPVRRKIQRQHQPRIADLEFLVANNPFTPPGSENLFARGLHAGFTGDLMLFGALVIPQIENSLRHVLSTSGVITSTLTSRLIQEERDLNVLLRLPEVAEIFGEDMVFEMQGLFVERFGANLRNRVAHGLVRDNSFYSNEVLYAWWLVLRLLCIPVIHRAKVSQSSTGVDAKLNAAPTVSTYGEHPQRSAQQSELNRVSEGRAQAETLEDGLDCFTEES